MSTSWDRRHIHAAVLRFRLGYEMGWKNQTVKADMPPAYYAGYAKGSSDRWKLKPRRVFIRK